MKTIRSVSSTSSLWMIVIAASVLGLATTYAVWKMQAMDCDECISRVPSSSSSDPPPCLKAPECELFLREWGWSFLLILTHLLPFALIPATMNIIWQRLEHLHSTNPNKDMSGFSLILGIASLGIACSFEFGYHVDQYWYYRDSFHTGNFFFYFFLISSFCLWADGFGRSRAVDALFVVCLVSFVLLYPIGASLHATIFKVPIYVALTVTFVFVTSRGAAMLHDRRMLWVPFFSVGVNLFFIALLKQVNENEAVMGKDWELSKWNYIYHVAHDLLGTEMGVGVFAYLIYNNPRHCDTTHHKQI